MLVFLQEPLLDWQREAQLLARLKGKKIAQEHIEGHEETHAQLKVIRMCNFKVLVCRKGILVLEC